MTSSTHTSKSNLMLGTISGIVVDKSIKIVIHTILCRFMEADRLTALIEFRYINTAHLRHLPSMKTRKIMDMNSILIQSLTYEAFDQSVRHLINLQGLENL